MVVEEAQVVDLRATFKQIILTCRSLVHRFVPPNNACMIIFDAVGFGVASLVIFTKYADFLWWRLRYLSQMHGQLDSYATDRKNMFLDQNHIIIFLKAFRCLLVVMN
ncbi:hypothetical protein M8C21_019142 [Ambrosia artemisiifolia]|uniref:Uncharacterized protein n=1 Tax=Ambrosia artemisiifolia TaxID=4212 RepID=A0AAD5D4M0_AMBAR|nr:hypothetical protein M8C21_019142 [Ambrosia artemisiifolia]